MIRTVRGDEKQGPNRYMIVGRLSEVGEAHLMLGRTRVVLPAPLKPDGLMIGEILTVCAHRQGGDYLAESVSPGFPSRGSGGRGFESPLASTGNPREPSNRSNDRSSNQGG
jgi:hypothetical protein